MKVIVLVGDMASGKSRLARLFQGMKRSVRIFDPWHPASTPVDRIIGEPDDVVVLCVHSVYLPEDLPSEWEVFFLSRSDRYAYPPP